jgi:uncharacterized membrane protein YdjX (TVP38/TMEM64 family)
MDEMTVPTQTRVLRKWLPWLTILILIAAAIIMWRPVSVLVREPDPVLLQAEVDRLGVLAPLGFFALTIIQIVGAPIPGYPIQILGGALFGTWLGGVYNIIGMVIGGLVATWLARTLGRPFIEKQVGPKMLAKYENLAHLESLWLWVVILSIPLGDFPYYIAGLSRVRFVTLALAILISRGPFTFVISWVGETSVTVPRWLFWALLAAILGIVVVGYLSKDKISLWLARHVLHRLQ